MIKSNYIKQTYMVRINKTLFVRFISFLFTGQGKKNNYIKFKRGSLRKIRSEIIYTIHLLFIKKISMRGKKRFKEIKLAWKHLRRLSNFFSYE